MAKLYWKHMLIRLGWLADLLFGAFADQSIPKGGACGLLGGQWPCVTLQDTPEDALGLGWVVGRHEGHLQAACWANIAFPPSPALSEGTEKMRSGPVYM